MGKMKREKQENLFFFCFFLFFPSIYPSIHFSFIFLIEADDVEKRDDKWRGYLCATVIWNYDKTSQSSREFSTVTFQWMGTADAVITTGDDWMAWRILDLNYKQNSVAIFCLLFCSFFFFFFIGVVYFELNVSIK